MITDISNLAYKQWRNLGTKFDRQFFKYQRKVVSKFLVSGFVELTSLGTFIEIYTPLFKRYRLY